MHKVARVCVFKGYIAGKGSICSFPLNLNVILNILKEGEALGDGWKSSEHKCH